MQRLQPWRVRDAEVATPAWPGCRGRDPSVARGEGVKTLVWWGPSSGVSGQKELKEHLDVGGHLVGRQEGEPGESHPSGGVKCRLHRWVVVGGVRVLVEIHKAVLQGRESGERCYLESKRQSLSLLISFSTTSPGLLHSS